MRKILLVLCGSLAISGLIACGKSPTAPTPVLTRTPVPGIAILTPSPVAVKKPSPATPTPVTNDGACTRMSVTWLNLPPDGTPWQGPIRAQFSNFPQGVSAVHLALFDTT